MMKEVIKKIARLIGNSISMPNNPNNETALLAIGAMLSKQQYSMNCGFKFQVQLFGRLPRIAFLAC